MKWGQCSAPKIKTCFCLQTSDWIHLPRQFSCCFDQERNKGACRKKTGEFPPIQMDVQHTKRLMSLSKDPWWHALHHELVPNSEVSPRWIPPGDDEQAQTCWFTTVMLQVHRFQQQKQATGVKALAIQKKWLSKHFKRSPKKKAKKRWLHRTKECSKATHLSRTCHFPPSQTQNL